MSRITNNNDWSLVQAMTMKLRHPHIAVTSQIETFNGARCVRSVGRYSSDMFAKALSVKQADPSILNRQPWVQASCFSRIRRQAPKKRCFGARRHQTDHILCGVCRIIKEKD